MTSRPCVWDCRALVDVSSFADLEAGARRLTERIRLIAELLN